MQSQTTKVSDFKLAEHFLRTVCRKLKVPFVDLEVQFDNQGAVPVSFLHNGAIVIRASKGIGPTLLAIIGTYMSQIQRITGGKASIDPEVQQRGISIAAAVIRGFMYSSKTLPEAWEKPMPSVSLSQFPFVWLMLRDIVCPLKQGELRDFKVILDRSPAHDAATLGQAEVNGEVAPVLFVNIDVESDTYRSAFLLSAAIRASGLNVSEVISEMLSGEEVKAKVYGLAKLAFVDPYDVNEFLMTLAAIGGFRSVDSLVDGLDSPVWKKAQAGPSGGYAGLQSWYATTLTESLLDAARGSDTQIIERLDTFRKDMWNRVAEEKKRRGKVDMNLEDLLRVQSKGMRPVADTILQGLLAEQRIW